jgi:acetyl-CoA carboxylase beta subunit
MQDSETESQEHVKRKQEEMNEDDHHEETKVRCSCPICGAMVLEEDINAHLDGCLNRSAVLKLVREEDKRDGRTGPRMKFKAPSQPRKRRR